MEADIGTSVALLIHAAIPPESTDGLLFSVYSEEQEKCAAVKRKKKRRVTAPDISD